MGGSWQNGGACRVAHHAALGSWICFWMGAGPASSLPWTGCGTCSSSHHAVALSPWWGCGTCSFLSKCASPQAHWKVLEGGAVSGRQLLRAVMGAVLDGVEWLLGRQPLRMMMGAVLAGLQWLQVMQLEAYYEK